jgi:hypothetical protein
MSISTSSHLVARVAGRLPLRTVLIVPFVLQMAGTVGLVGYLSFRNGQQAVNDVASQLRNEISDRIEICCLLAIALVKFREMDKVELRDR